MGKAVEKVYCLKCHQEIPPERAKLGYKICVNCSQEQKVKVVEISASSLQWI